MANPVTLNHSGTTISKKDPVESDALAGTPRARKIQEDDADLIVELTKVYISACDDKDYHMCKLIRSQIEIVLTGKTGIKIEDGLNLPGTLDF
jgi:hypothetical protein